MKIPEYLRDNAEPYQIEDRWFVWAPKAAMALELIERHVGHELEAPEVRYLGVRRPISADGETWSRFAIRSRTQEVPV